MDRRIQDTGVLYRKTESWAKHGLSGLAGTAAQGGSDCSVQ